MLIRLSFPSLKESEILESVIRLRREPRSFRALQDKLQTVWYEGFEILGI